MLKIRAYAEDILGRKNCGKRGLWYYMEIFSFPTMFSMFSESQLLTTFRKKPFESIVGKEENSFSSFPTIFSSLANKISIFY